MVISRVHNMSKYTTSRTTRKFKSIFVGTIPPISNDFKPNSNNGLSWENYLQTDRRDRKWNCYSNELCGNKFQLTTDSIMYIMCTLMLF